MEAIQSKHSYLCWGLTVENCFSFQMVLNKPDKPFAFWLQFSLYSNIKSAWRRGRPPAQLKLNIKQNEKLKYFLEKIIENNSSNQSMFVYNIMHKILFIGIVLCF